MGKPFNGGLEAAWTLFNQYKIVGGICVAITAFVLTTNRDHTEQQEIKAMVKTTVAVQDDVLIKQKETLHFMRDSLTTNDDIDRLLAQAQGVHDDLYKHVFKLEGKSGDFKYGRGIYRKSYGPVPPEKFKHWFWQE